ncbi:MAG: glycosyl transferase family 1, partial [Candidatus Latescibacteria bacterium]|nr:glycosyl transferase family 1 [Candidatus Latescibacterota bacterium]
MSTAQRGQTIFMVGKYTTRPRKPNKKKARWVSPPSRAFCRTPEGAGPHTHHYLRSFEAAVRRGQQVARVAERLHRVGYQPDLVCCHPAWGEGLYLRDIWPDTVLLYFCEFFYHARGC